MVFLSAYRNPVPFLPVWPDSPPQRDNTVLRLATGQSVTAPESPSLVRSSHRSHTGSGLSTWLQTQSSFLTERCSHSIFSLMKLLKYNIRSKRSSSWWRGGSCKDRTPPQGPEERRGRLRGQIPKKPLKTGVLWSQRWSLQGQTDCHLPDN